VTTTKSTSGFSSRPVVGHDEVDRLGAQPRERGGDVRGFDDVDAQALQEPHELVALRGIVFDDEK